MIQQQLDRLDRLKPQKYADVDATGSADNDAALRPSNAALRPAANGMIGVSFEETTNFKVVLKNLKQLVTVTIWLQPSLKNWV